MLWQVIAPRAGKIGFDSSTLFSCPVGSNFQDTFNGLYGLGAYPARSPYCSDDTVEGTGKVLVSALSFQCTVCPSEQYSLFGGLLNGSTRLPTNYPCQQCPVGGTCIDGIVSAAPGFWGAPGIATPLVVRFSLCPDGYCCDGSKSWPCSSINPCAGHRSGVLCGDCAEGYVESVGSSQCTTVSACTKDTVVFWSLALLGELFTSLLQLTAVSGVWLPSPQHPSGKMKLVIYFAQVRRCRKVWALGSLKA